MSALTLSEQKLKLKGWFGLMAARWNVKNYYCYENLVFKTKKTSKNLEKIS
jgi:hypothetical protein